MFSEPTRDDVLPCGWGQEAQTGWCPFSVQKGRFEFSCLTEFIFLLLYLNNFIYLLLAVLGTSRCAGFSLVAERCVWVVVAPLRCSAGFLIVPASLAAGHGHWGPRASVVSVCDSVAVAP